MSQPDRGNILQAVRTLHQVRHLVEPNSCNLLLKLLLLLHALSICQSTPSAPALLQRERDQGELTSSTVPRIIYRITRTSFFCPNRVARAMAWFSTLGFHCSSTMKIRLAQVRFNLSRAGLLVKSGRSHKGGGLGTGGMENLPVRPGPGRHDQNGVLLARFELVEVLLPLEVGAAAVDAEIRDVGLLQVAGQQFQGPCPAREDDAKPSC